MTKARFNHDDTTYKGKYEDRFLITKARKHEKRQNTTRATGRKIGRAEKWGGRIMRRVEQEGAESAEIRATVNFEEESGEE